MERYSVDIPVPYGERINLFPLSDIHDGDPGCRADLLTEHIKQCSRRENPHWFLVGDTSEFAAPSVQRALMATIERSPMESTRPFIDDAVADKITDLVGARLQPLVNRTLFCGEGHHGWRARGGETTEMMVARLLGAKYVGPSAKVRIRLIPPEKTNNSRPAEIVIVAIHGDGSGRLRSAAFNRLERWVNTLEGVDAVFMAHYHLRGMTEIARNKTYWPERGGTPYDTNRGMLWMLTGGWLDGYLPDRKMIVGETEIPIASYVEKKMLTASPIGGCRLEIEHKMEAGGRARAIIQPSFVNL